MAGFWGDVAAGGGVGRFGLDTFCANALPETSDSAITSAIVIIAT